MTGKAYGNQSRWSQRKPKKYRKRHVHADAADRWLAKKLKKNYKEIQDMFQSRR